MLVSSGTGVASTARPSGSKNRAPARCHRAGQSRNVDLQWQQKVRQFGPGDAPPGHGGTEDLAQGHGPGRSGPPRAAAPRSLLARAWSTAMPRVRNEGPKGPFRAITRAITPGQSGVFTVTRGRSTQEHARPSKQQNRRSEAPDLRFLWWPGAGSNRRPSDFQSDARTN
jgi:hypothetical protein